MPVAKQIHHAFFKTWSPDMAYVLGFLYADGSVYLNKTGNGYLSLQIKDKALLYAIRFRLRATQKISRRVHARDGSVFYRIQIGSKELLADLKSVGLCERKTHRMQLPDIPEKFFGSFVRGYFDGDGNVWVGYVHKERATPLLTLQTVFTSCSHEFLHDLQVRLSRVGIEGSMRTVPGLSRLQFSKKSSILLHTLMYEDDCGDLFLRRKRVVFEKYMRQTMRV
jgi:intein-encoded DNA endonuclease-like protein